MGEYQIAVVGYGGIDYSFYNHLMDLKDGKTPRQVLKKALKEVYGEYFTDDRVYDVYIDFVEYYIPNLMDTCRRIIDEICRIWEEVFHSLLNIANRLFVPSFEKLADAFRQIISVEVDDIHYGSVCVRTAKVRTKKNSYYMGTVYSANLNSTINQRKRHYQYCRRNF